MKKLYRIPSKKMIAGVCAGIGDYFKVDPSLIRIICIALGVFSIVLPFVIAYLIAWFIIPEAPKGYKFVPYKKLYRSEKNRFLSGFCGGLAEYFKLDASVVRLVYLALATITAGASLLVTYIIGSIIIPVKPHKDQAIEIEID